MTNRLTILLSITFLIGCNISEKKSINRIEKREIISTSEIVFDSISFTPILPKIETDKVNKWFSKITNDYILENKLYFAGYYFVLEEINNISVLITYFLSDDFSKCFLMTIDKRDNLVDMVEVAHEYDHFYEDSSRYIEIEGIVETEIISNNEFLKLEKEKIEFFIGENLDSISKFVKQIKLTISESGIIEEKEILNKNVP